MSSPHIPDDDFTPVVDVDVAGEAFKWVYLVACDALTRAYLRVDPDSYLDDGQLLSSMESRQGAIRILSAIDIYLRVLSHLGEGDSGDEFIGR